MKETSIVEIQKEINEQVKSPEVMKALVDITFKGLQPSQVKRAIMEGMMRGYKFVDFLEKNVYAIPFRDSYSLVTSIDHARKLGMRSGVVGKSAPEYTYTDETKKTVESCTVTVKRSVAGYVGDYTATVFFKEYTTGRNLWISKPMTMIAKVAEMHALRMACPEELAQMYTEEEFQQQEVPKQVVNVSDHKAKLATAQNLYDLKEIWANIPAKAKVELKELKNELKSKLEYNENSSI